MRYNVHLRDIRTGYESDLRKRLRRGQKISPAEGRRLSGATKRLMQDALFDYSMIVAAIAAVIFIGTM